MDAPLPALRDAYLQAIATKAAGTRNAYRRILRDLSTWLAAKPGGATGFVPDQLTQTAVTIYPEQLQAAGYSRSHRARIKAVISGFARYLIEEHGALRRNPTRGVSLPPAAAWLDAKSHHSKSRETANAYTATMGKFRAALAHIGLDLGGDYRAVALVAQAFAAAGDVRPSTHNRRLAIVSSF